ncbi:unnamed protein product [Mycetohabitans rhizoxinica HKI 454]|uniref:Uncharacterized protein n=1 Tax=Mycetohabitans rhizoxinica (strain DSM 19002 / CIP 109453 / HKI 454) TaxID=882378 RepID=E5ASZ8_MYCRK|nr:MULTISPECIES: hypothetical protein [Mycetohabitans]MCG1045911.1 hypothetical protein [Mycetohabitans sp. B6]CBW73542.1 unnamed protein product [Mycetohabitans rhizoxinica HKI 454]
MESNKNPDAEKEVNEEGSAVEDPWSLPKLKSCFEAKHVPRQEHFDAILDGLSKCFKAIGIDSEGKPELPENGLYLNKLPNDNYQLSVYLDEKRSMTSKTGSVAVKVDQNRRIGSNDKGLKCIFKDELKGEKNKSGVTMLALQAGYGIEVTKVSVGGDNKRVQLKIKSKDALVLDKKEGLGLKCKENSGFKLDSTLQLDIFEGKGLVIPDEGNNQNKFSVQLDKIRGVKFNGGLSLNLDAESHFEDISKGLCLKQSDIFSKEVFEDLGKESLKKIYNLLRSVFDENGVPFGSKVKDFLWADAVCGRYDNYRSNVGWFSVLTRNEDSKKNSLMFLDQEERKDIGEIVGNSIVVLDNKLVGIGVCEEEPVFYSVDISTTRYRDEKIKLEPKSCPETCFRGPLCFSSDGSRVIFLDGDKKDVSVYYFSDAADDDGGGDNEGDGDVKKEYEKSNDFSSNDGLPPSVVPTCVTLSGNGKFAAVGDKEKIYFFKEESGKNWTKEEHECELPHSGLAIGENADYFAAIEENTIGIYRIKRGNSAIQSIDKVQTLNYSARSISMKVIENLEEKKEQYLVAIKAANDESSPLGMVFKGSVIV